MNDAIYFRTRHAAIEWLGEQLTKMKNLGQRALCGFDFAFGYPQGFASAVTGTDHVFALWDWLVDRIRDDENNANNRYAVAAEMAAKMGAEPGPFWGCPASVQQSQIPQKKSDLGFAFRPDRRIVEQRIAATKTVWQLAYAGAVGSQTLLGIPWLAGLHQKLGAAIWPFHAADTSQIVFAEVYPSLLNKIANLRKSDGPLDRAQVITLAHAFWNLDQKAGLAPLFSRDLSAELSVAQRQIVHRQEGWILGADHQPKLEAALS